MRPVAELALGSGCARSAGARLQRRQWRGSRVTLCLFLFRLIGYWQLLILDPRMKKTLCKTIPGDTWGHMFGSAQTPRCGLAGAHSSCTSCLSPARCRGAAGPALCPRVLPWGPAQCRRAAGELPSSWARLSGGPWGSTQKCRGLDSVLAAAVHPLHSLGALLPGRPCARTEGANIRAGLGGGGVRIRGWGARSG